MDPTPRGPTSLLAARAPGGAAAAVAGAAAGASAAGGVNPVSCKTFKQTHVCSSYLTWNHQLYRFVG